MKLKTSITLAADVVKSVDRLAGRDGSRSAVIERAVRELIEREAQLARNARDLELLNRHAERLNREAEDVLAFQSEP